MSSASFFSAYSIKLLLSVRFSLHTYATTYKCLRFFFLYLFVFLGVCLYVT